MEGVEELLNKAPPPPPATPSPPPPPPPPAQQQQSRVAVVVVERLPNNTMKTTPITALEIDEVDHPNNNMNELDQTQPMEEEEEVQVQKKKKPDFFPDLKRVVDRENFQLPAFLSTPEAYADFLSTTSEEEKFQAFMQTMIKEAKPKTEIYLLPIFRTIAFHLNDFHDYPPLETDFLMTYDKVKLMMSEWGMLSLI